MNTPRTMQFSVVPDGTEIDNLGCPHEKGKVIICFSKPRYQEKGKAIISKKTHSMVTWTVDRSENKELKEISSSSTKKM